MSNLQSRRTGLTLMELIVVLVILIGLATLVLPRISGVTEQVGNSTSASILQGISEAMGRFEAQYGKLPTSWDGVLDNTGAVYSNLHPNLLTSLDAYGTMVGVGTLTAMQAKSLNDSGVTGLHFQDPAYAGPASESGQTFTPVASGMKFAQLQLPTSAAFPGHNKLFSDRAFSIHHFTPLWNNTFVVVGFGNEASLKRNAVQDTPMFSAANPSKYYARGLVVLMVPPSSVTAATDLGYFKARYVGCFAPDGTCLMDNVANFQKQQAVN